MKISLKTLAIPAIAVLSVGFALALKGSESSKLQAHVNDVMKQYVAAFKKLDSKATEAVIRANFSPDYTTTGMDGKSMNLDDFLKQDAQHIASIKKVKSANLKMTGVKVTGDTATGKGSFVMNATIVNMKDPKKTSKLHVDSKWVSTLKKVDGKWWVAADKSTSETVTIDGKPVPPGM